MAPCVVTARAVQTNAVIASSLQPSPVDAEFSATTSPRVKIEPDINYDHMPDGMFSPV